MKAKVRFGNLNEVTSGESKLSRLVGKGKSVAIMKALDDVVSVMPVFFVAKITATENGKKTTYMVSGSRLRLANWLADAVLQDPQIEILEITSDRNKARSMAQEV